MRILLLGATGFIGSAIARHLLGAGCEVIGFARSRPLPPSTPRLQRWMQGDLNNLTSRDDWVPYLKDVDAVINASGALQSGGRDQLGRSQEQAIVALIEACGAAGVERFVQISAPGANADASTEFLRTKAAADDRLRASRLAWTVLRPGLVVGRAAYGGTALIRALAAFPLIVPLMRTSGTIQTVALEDVVRVAALAATDKVESGREIDLVEARRHSLRDVILTHRAWLGLPPPVAVIAFPTWATHPIGWLADALSWLGWRSPLRTTALRVMREDVAGDPERAKAMFGTDFSDLAETLAGFASAQQDRWQARLFLLLPLIVLSLAILWVGSGLIGFARTQEAASVLGNMDASRARFLVQAGSTVDIVLGLAILVRRAARTAALGMAAMTLIYIIGAALFRADLWLDPLGAMLKTLPVLMLALVAWVILEER